MALWDQSGLEYIGQGLPSQTFPLFLKRVMLLIHQPQLFMAIVALLWSIWRSRNWVVFEGKQFGFPALMRQFHQQYQEWISLSLGRCQRLAIPLPQSLGVAKNGSHSAGGMVILSRGGAVLLARGI
ncbi:unnamed protein product [Linum trigynum]|uniref:Uncharacterized protein n=1 Tax=Linum trigynum TaxID=586398 RepID=A0AAV2CKU4_9ROSI